MKRSYDLVAGMYDAMAKFCFGGALHDAQIYFLHKINPHARILIVGGGTGKILEDITNVYPQHICIDYVDSSGEMIARARKRYMGLNSVTFYQQSIFDFACSASYDVIITPFFLDNFSEDTLPKVFALLHQKLQPGGIWLHTDFQISHKNSYWQRAALFTMYSFFHIACNVEATKLYNVIPVFNKYDYRLAGSKTFFHEFVVSLVYEKN